MNEINNKQTETNVRRTFIQKFLGIIAAALLMPAITKLFASTNKWKELSTAGVNKPLNLEPYIGEICIFGFNFAPNHWAYCNGQLIAIASNTALFSILGTNYGGNGTTTFALPDLQGRVPMGTGQGDGLTNRFVGELGGQESCTLISTEIPGHVHIMLCNSGTGNSADPSSRYFASDPLGNAHYGSSNGDSYNLSYSGSNFAHNNVHPYLALNFSICLAGVFPPRS